MGSDDASAPAPLVPRVYPHGGPLYWRDEASGVLPAAVMAYLHARETPAQLALVIDYCVYWCEAPCWRGDGLELTDLRQRGRMVTTRAGLQAWLWDLLRVGIDPL